MTKDVSYSWDCYPAHLELGHPSPSVLLALGVPWCCLPLGFLRRLVSWGLGRKWSATLLEVPKPVRPQVLSRGSSDHQCALGHMLGAGGGPCPAHMPLPGSAPHRSPGHPRELLLGAVSGQRVALFGLCGCEKCSKSQGFQRILTAWRASWLPADRPLGTGRVLCLWFSLFICEMGTVRAPVLGRVPGLRDTPRSYITEQWASCQHRCCPEGFRTLETLLSPGCAVGTWRAPVKFL